MYLVAAYLNTEANDGFRNTHAFQNDPKSHYPFTPILSFVISLRCYYHHTAACIHRRSGLLQDARRRTSGRNPWRKRQTPGGWNGEGIYSDLPETRAFPFAKYRAHLNGERSLMRLAQERH